VLEGVILRIAAEEKAVHKPNGVYTVHMGPDQVVAELSLEFEDVATAPEIEAAVESIEKQIRVSRGQDAVRETATAPHLARPPAADRAELGAWGREANL